MRAGDTLRHGDPDQAEDAAVAVAMAAGLLGEAELWLGPVATADPCGDLLYGAQAACSAGGLRRDLRSVRAGLEQLWRELERRTERRVHPDAARLIDPAVEDSAGFPLAAS